MVILIWWFDHFYYIAKLKLEYLMATPGQSAKLNACQSVFVAKLPNSMSAKRIIPMVCVWSV